MARIALCCCGSLRAETIGEPALVAACHCLECQRRTGSPVGVSAYFAKQQVRTEGTSKVYVRGSDSGRKIEFHFCPTCGATLFWNAEFVPELLGIAFGAFAEGSMPPPSVSLWEATWHCRVTFGRELDRFGRQVERIERGCQSPPMSARAEAISPTGHAATGRVVRCCRRRHRP